MVYALVTRLWQPRVIIAGLLLGSLCLFLPSAERPASGQAVCQVDCNATAPNSAAVGANAAFAVTSTANGCATPVSYEWDFGDGSARESAANTTHAYSAPGTYTWRMTARAGNGLTTIDTVAGGYGEGLEVNQAAFTRPTASARDPLGRGLFVAEQTANESGVRFINTSTAAVTLANKLIAPGTSRVLLAVDNQFSFAIDFLAVGLAVSPEGNVLFISNVSRAEVSALNVSNTAQTIFGTTLAPGRALPLVFGGDNGFSQPGGIAVHPQTGQVYFTDGARVFRITGLNTMATVAGNGAFTLPQDAFVPGPALNISLLQVRDLAFDATGALYLADAGHARVVKLDANGQLALVAQLPLTRLANTARESNPFPSGLAILNGNVYTATGNQQTVLQLTGPGLTQPVVVAGAAASVCVYGNSSCGDGGPVAGARFNLPGSSATPFFIGLDADANGLFILDQGEVRRGRVRYLNLSAGPVTLAGVTVPANQATTLAGTGAAEPFDGPALGAALSQPSGVALDANGNLWFADTQHGTLRFVNRGAQPVTLFANTAAAQTVAPGRLITINREVAPDAPDNVPVNQASFDTPQGLLATSQGIFLVDARKGPTLAGAHNPIHRRADLIRFINTGNQDVTFYAGTINQIVVQKGFVRTIAGGGFDTAESVNDGVFTSEAKFVGATDVAISPVTNDIYVADQGNSRVRRIRRATGEVSTITELPGARILALTNPPTHLYSSVAFDATGRLLVLDTLNNRLLRRNNPDSTQGVNGFTTLLSGGLLNSPRDLAVDAAGNLYVTNAGDQRVLKLTISGNTATAQVIAGSTQGFGGDDGPALNAQLNLSADPLVISTRNLLVTVPALAGVAVGPTGEVFFADSKNRRIRRVDAGAVTCSKTGSITITGNAPLPTLSQLAPATAYVGQSFTLTVNGGGFGPGSQVHWNGSARTTTFVSATQLKANILAGDLTAPGTAAVTVLNPTPGGGNSNALSLPVVRLTGLPAIAVLNPERVEPGTAFRLSVFGSNFTANSVVRLNGQARPTTFIDAGSLKADISVSGLPANGVAVIHVFTSETGGGLSSPATLQIGCVPLVILPAALPSATLGVFYSQPFVVPNAAGAATLMVSNGSLPPGLVLPPGQVLQGTPTATGVFNFTLTAMDGGLCTGAQNYSISVQSTACGPLDIVPIVIPDGTKGVAYSQTFFATGKGNTNSVTQTAGALPPGLTLSAGGLLSGTPTQGGSFAFTLTTTSPAGCQFSRGFTLGIRDLTIRLVDAPKCVGSGDTLTLEIACINHTAITQSMNISAVLPNTAVTVPNSCSVNTGDCFVSVSAISWSAILQPNQRALIRYRVQLVDNLPSNTQLCLNATVFTSVNILYSAQSCLSAPCPPVGPGANNLAFSPLSDQKAGSVLLFNLYTSDAGAPNRQNTRFSLTNIETARTTYVHLFFVDGASCSIADSIVCLTPNQTSTFFAADVDPGTTGYLIAVAMDRTGCPINFNYLIGDAFVKLSSGHAANLGAEAIAALPGGFVPCDPQAAAVELRFDDRMYNALPRVLALSNITSRADGNNTLLVVNRIGGNLSTGASTLVNVFGVLYDDAEAPFSFSFSPGTCQFRSIISSNFPRTAPRFEQVIPAGRSGWLKVGMQTEGALSGAALNFNANAATTANAFNQGHNLHKLTLTTAATLTVPVFPPSC